MAKASEHARALSELGAAKGGKARAERLSPEERAASARKAADARWGGKVSANASHVGQLLITDSPIECAVLEDGRRVLTQETFLTAIGRSSKGKGGQITSGPDGLPPFLSANALKPFINEELKQATVPIVYRTPKGTRAYGYDAALLPKVCNVYLQARDAGSLTKQQAHVAMACDMLMRGLAHVGIIALVDEATGFQKDRSRRALEEILDTFIKDELGKWMKMFPDEFYSELFRLKGMQYIPFPTKRPRYVGIWTNDIVYKRIAPGVLDELKKQTPKDSKGRHQHKLHQRLTEDVGHPRLREHLASVITLMKASDEWEEFHKMLERALPKYKEMPLFGDEHEDDQEG